MDSNTNLNKSSEVSEDINANSSQEIDLILNKNKMLVFNQFYEFFESDFRNPNRQKSLDLDFESKDKLNKTGRKLTKYERRLFKKIEKNVIVSGKVLKIQRDGGKPVFVEVLIKKIEAEVISTYEYNEIVRHRNLQQQQNRNNIHPQHRNNFSATEKHFNYYYDDSNRKYFLVDEMNDLPSQGIIGRIHKYDIFDNKLPYLNDELEKNLEEGAEIYCLVINNKLSDEDKFGEAENYYSDSFLDLSLKNSLIKGLHQRMLDNCKADGENLTSKNLHSKIILGIKFTTKNLDTFASENLALDNDLNDPNCLENNYDYSEFKAYDKYLSYKSNKISGFSYEKIRRVQNYDWSDEYFKKAQIMIDLANYDKAIEYLKEAQKLDELNHEIYEKKGICYFHKKELDQAKKEFKQALHLESDSYISKSYLNSISKMDQNISASEKKKK